MGLGKNLSTEQLAAVTSLCKAGHCNKEISMLTGVSLRSVQRWTKVFRDSPDGELPLQKKPPGRPRKTDKRALNIVKRQLDSNPRMTAREIRESNPALFSHVSISTVGRLAHEKLQFTSRPARKKPLVTNRQKANRIKFAKEKLTWTHWKWRNVLWSDEATFTVTCNRKGKVYMRPGSDPYDPKFTCKTVKNPDSIMFWGCFGFYGVGPLIALPRNETMNSEKYLMLLTDHLYDAFDQCKLMTRTGIKGVFQQDGATCHTAKIISEYLDFCGIDYIKPWPGNSPDLNPIENLWAIIKHELKNRDISSLPKLEAEVRNVWGNLSKELLQKLALSLPDRLKEVIARKGNTGKY